MHLPHAELAFLAACHSAAAESGSEEVLHLAAAVQFCGFQSVIGTLWEMEDGDGPELAKGFYQSLLTLKEGSRGSARALNDAIKRMREEGMTLGRWATFVHIGA
jgi:CHAT domain-containing protein